MNYVPLIIWVCLYIYYLYYLFYLPLVAFVVGVWALGPLIEVTWASTRHCRPRCCYELRQRCTRIWLS